MQVLCKVVVSLHNLTTAVLVSFQILFEPPCSSVRYLLLFSFVMVYMNLCVIGQEITSFHSNLISYILIICRVRSTKNILRFGASKNLDIKLIQFINLCSPRNSHRHCLIHSQQTLTNLNASDFCNKIFVLNRKGIANVASRVLNNFYNYIHRTLAKPFAHWKVINCHRQRYNGNC